MRLASTVSAFREFDTGAVTLMHIELTATAPLKNAEVGLAADTGNLHYFDGQAAVSLKAYIGGIFSNFGTSGSSRSQA
jgi:hypothetical protein